MYDVTNTASFELMDKLKKEIDRNKEKKEVCETGATRRLAPTSVRHVDSRTAGSEGRGVGYTDPSRLWS